MGLINVFNKGPTCNFCGSKVKGRKPAGDVWVYCEECGDKIPASLIKACYDSFFYVAYIRGLGVFEFTDAKIHGEWVWLDRTSNYELKDHPPYPFERGIDVRLSEILWCADAPNGS
jgi:hypothetical protein